MRRMLSMDHVTASRSHGTLKRVIALIGCALIAACTPAEADTSADQGPALNSDLAAVEAKGLTEQAAILKDGAVTSSEYATAVDLTIECYQSAGVEVRGPWLNPVDNLTYLFDFPGGPPSGAAPGCDSKYLSHVQPVYLETHDSVMSSDLKAYVDSCLLDEGYPSTAPDKNAGEMSARLGIEATQDLAQCITDGAVSLYPEQVVYFITW